MDVKMALCKGVVHRNNYMAAILDNIRRSKGQTIDHAYQWPTEHNSPTVKKTLLRVISMYK